MSGKTIGTRGLASLVLASTILAATAGFPGAHADSSSITATNPLPRTYFRLPTLVVQAGATGISVYGSGFTSGGTVDISYSQDPTQLPPGANQGPEPATAVRVEVLTADQPGNLYVQCLPNARQCRHVSDGGRVFFNFLSNPCRTWTVQGYDETSHNVTANVRVLSAGCVR